MRYPGPLFLLLLTLCFPLTAVAAGDDIPLQQVVAALEGPFKAAPGRAAAIRDFQVDFRQESEIVSLDQKQTATGRALFLFLPAGEKTLVSPLFRWEYLEPHQQKIVSDGKSVWFHIPENRQVILSDARRSLTGDEHANPLAFLTHIDDLGRFFEISWAAPRQDGAGNYLLRLLPREKSPLLQSLVLGVAREAVKTPERKTLFPLCTVEMTNVNGDRSRILLSQARLNQGLAAGDFRFVPPEGTDILTPEQFRKAFQ